MDKEELDSTIKVLEIYKKEHKQDWRDFMKGMLWGYMHSVPKYEEAKVSDFEEWLAQQKEDK